MKQAAVPVFHQPVINQFVIISDDGVFLEQYNIKQS
jgi:hypothetical protein